MSLVSRIEELESKLARYERDGYDGLPSTLPPRASGMALLSSWHHSAYTDKLKNPQFLLHRTGKGETPILTHKHLTLPLKTLSMLDQDPQASSALLQVSPHP